MRFNVKCLMSYIRVGLGGEETWWRGGVGRCGRVAQARVGVRAGEVWRGYPAAAGRRRGRRGDGAVGRPAAPRGSFVRIRRRRCRLWLPSCELTRIDRGRDRRGALPVTRLREPGCRRRNYLRKRARNVTRGPLSRACAPFHAAFNQISKSGATTGARQSPRPEGLRALKSRRSRTCDPWDQFSWCCRSSHRRWFMRPRPIARARGASARIPKPTKAGIGCTVSIIRTVFCPTWLAT